ncbi:EAL domain-containing protein [Actinotalea subterranea]|uniref:EAL domain-containing protein n=1 Tax=Actinotalea subterranea TaxID=2607497 RepID=UPI0011EC953C|nr:EAL domain-containing protein [Actinotalea subterranea]
MSHEPGTGSAPNGLDPGLDHIWTSNLLDSSREVIYFKDLESRFIRVSLGCAELHRTTQDALLGLSDFDLFDEKHASAAYADEQQIIATGEPMLNKQERERWVDRPDTFVSSSKFPLRAPDGSIIGTFGISRDVTSLVQNEQEMARLADMTVEANAELSRVESQLRAVLDGSTDAIARYDHELRYQYMNPAGERSRGTSLAELLGRTDRETGMAEASLEIWEPALRRVLETGEPDEVEFSVPDGADGEETWFHTTISPDRDTTGDVVGVLTSTRDITEVKRAEQALAHQAMHDSVTGLANRYLLTDRLAQALVRMERYPARIALFFIDLDYFKDVNDTYGHDVGDRVLADVARRLEGVARKQDTVARLGGDEFVVLCDRVLTDEDASDIADRIVHALGQPLVEGKLHLRLSGSVGAVITDDPTSDPGELIRSADAAMYKAKQGGRNRFQVFDPREHEGTTECMTLEAELRGALERHELRLRYQPLLSLSDQRLLGFEALLRWEHPERGLLGPKDFLAAAESRGLIGPIGAWVLDAACAQLALWCAQRGPTARPLSMAVNVSGRQLREPDLLEQVCTVLDRHGLAPEQLCLEFSERSLVQDGPDARETLEALNLLGVRLAVDDFGATYTSLARLPRFPVSVVKVERGADEEWHRNLVGAVIAMAHGLGMSVVGEGIETPAQLRELIEMACDDGQGFLLGQPLSHGEVAQLLAADSRRDGPDRGSARALAAGSAPRGAVARLGRDHGSSDEDRELGLAGHR